jgi:hypothetical protein
VLRVFSVNRCFRGPWRDGVHSDAARHELGGQRAHE